MSPTHTCNTQHASRTRLARNTPRLRMYHDDELHPHIHEAQQILKGVADVSEMAR